MDSKTQQCQDASSPSVTKSQRKMNEHPWKLFHRYCIGCLSTAATKSLTEGIWGEVTSAAAGGAMDRGAVGLRGHGSHCIGRQGTVGRDAYQWLAHFLLFSFLLSLHSRM